MTRRICIGLFGALLLGGAHTLPAQVPAPLPVEESDVFVLPTPSPRWVVVNSDWAMLGARIFDGDSGKMMGQIHIAKLSNIAADPKGRFFYVAESIWSKGNRGTRQDMLTVRDARTLKVLREIPLPGRLLVSYRKHDLSISADGRRAFVYNMDPATSVIVVDLDRNRVAGTVEVPGCGLSASVAGGRVLSLCSDGALAVTTVNARGRGEVARSQPFFSAEEDPIFDNFPVDPSGSGAMMVSYSGLVYPVSLGEKAEPGQPWSLQEAAGLPRGATAPLIVNWLPGGRQPAAFHKASGRLYVLMHMGEQWTQKEPGTELWVLDAATRKLVTRKKLEHEASYVEVGQDAQPLLYLHQEGKLIVLDAATLEQKREIEEVGTGALTVFGGGS